MNQTLRYTFILLLFALIWSCNNSEDESRIEANESETAEIPTKVLTEAEYKAMATELCDCLKPLVELQAKVNSRSEEEIKAMVSEIEKISNESTECVNKLENKYGQIRGKDNEEKAKEAMVKVCPHIAGVINKF